MTSAVEVCVDARLAIKEVAIEPDSTLADSLFKRWAIERTRLIAPEFFREETDSILRQKVVLRKELTDEEAETAFKRLQALQIELVIVPGQRQRAWELARQFNMPTVYD